MAMRTLCLLTTLFLLALQTRAEPVQRIPEEVPVQGWLGEDQDVSISFGGDKSASLQDAGVRQHRAGDREWRERVETALKWSHLGDFITSLFFSLTARVK